MIKIQDKDIALAEEFLKQLIEFDPRESNIWILLTDYKDFKRSNELYNYSILVTGYLLNEKLIEYGETEYRFKITPLGRYACEITLKQFIKDRKKETQLTNIRDWLNAIGSFSGGFMAILSLFFSLFTFYISSKKADEKGTTEKIQLIEIRMKELEKVNSLNQIKLAKKDSLASKK